MSEELNLNIDNNNEKGNSDQFPERIDLKSELLNNIYSMEMIINDNDSFEDLIISYLVIEENKNIKNNFNFEDIWLLINKICISWNTKDLLGFDVPISKEELKEIYDQTKENELENFENDFLNLYQIKPIILIIFENIINGYRRIIEYFN